MLGSGYGRPGDIQKLFDACFQIYGIAVGLRDLEPGPVVKLDAVAFRVEEIHAQGIAVADGAFDGYILGLEALVILFQVFNAVDDE